MPTPQIPRDFNATPYKTSCASPTCFSPVPWTLLHLFFNSILLSSILYVSIFCILSILPPPLLIYIYILGNENHEIIIMNWRNVRFTRYSVGLRHSCRYSDYHCFFLGPLDLPFQINLYISFFNFVRSSRANQLLNFSQHSTTLPHLNLTVPLE